MWEVSDYDWAQIKSSSLLGEGEERGKKSEFLHFNEWEPNRSEKRNADVHADSTQ